MSKTDLPKGQMASGLGKTTTATATAAVMVNRTGSTTSSTFIVNFSEESNAQGGINSSIIVMSASENQPNPDHNRHGPLKSVFGDGPDLQEVACDTSELQKRRRKDPLLMNFSQYGSDIKMFNTHIGLRRKIQPLGASVSSSSTTDDYNRGIVEYLMTQTNLHQLQLILEISPDDDTYEYKPYNNIDLLPLYCPKIPTSVYHVHVEMPGISSDYLPEWKYFLEQQTSMQTLICNFGVVLWEFYAPAIQKNSDTLKKVVLRRVQSYKPESHKHIPLDWSIFSKCRNLTYLKITCGYKDRWTEWRSYSRPLPNETLVHKNIDTLPKESLVEFHFAKFIISKPEMQNLLDTCNSLEVLCPNCPDWEYYDGDLTLPLDGLGDVVYGFAGTDYMIDGSISGASRRKDKNALISLLLILFGIGFVAIVILICVAVYFSHPGSD